jgi:Dolichyl-phosphate-mannose-protein mannosyltransferase
MEASRTLLARETDQLGQESFLVGRLRHASSWQLLTCMIAASFGIRIAAWVYFGTGTIESEGAEYARIAENLRNGVGYVGLVSSGPQVLFNPLFSLLIAGASFLVGDYEQAGRVVALVMGALLPLPVFGIASRLFNRSVGLAAGLLAVLHPLSVYLSFMVYSEGPYATLFLTAIYVVIRALDNNSTWRWLVVGGVFGVCYLLRAEALASLLISLAFSLVAGIGRLPLRAKRTMYAAAVFISLALPQVIFLYKSTGRILLEGKSTVLFSYAGRRILAAERNPGVEYVSDGGLRDIPTSEPNVDGGYPDRWEDKWATYAINSDLKGTGFSTRPWVDMVRETHLRIGDFIPLLSKGVRRNLPNLLGNFSARWLGAPLLPALALLGAFAHAWRRPQAALRAYVLVIAAAPIAATMFVLWGDSRYYFIFVPLLCIWAANGLFTLGSWAKESAAAAGWSWGGNRVVSQWMFPGLVALTMVILSIGPVHSQYEFSDSAWPNRIDKEVGLWLRQQRAPRARIMDTALPVTYHAGGDLVYFPYCSSDLAVRYLDATRVDYVVLRRGIKFTHYYEDWLTHGIPDGRAERLQLPPGAGEKFVIYKWNHNSN